MLSLVVVEDHTVLAELIGLALAAEPDVEMLGHAQGVAQGIEMVETLRPDVVLMDVRLGDGDGIAATAELTARHPRLRVVIMTAHVEARLLRRAVEAGACGLLPKDGDLASMLSMLRKARRGTFLVSPTTTSALEEDAGTRSAGGLTPREQEVLRLLATGLDVRMIARETGISLNTCREHVKNILGKLDSHSQLEAVATAVRRGLIDVAAGR